MRRTELLACTTPTADMISLRHPVAGRGQPIIYAAKINDSGDSIKATFHVSKKLEPIPK